jgi:hypothetical protein
MRKALIVALSLSMFCAACSTAWVSTLNSILAVAAPALVNILQIVAVANAEPVNGDLAAKINADTTSIKSLAADFAKASSASAPGVCEQLQAAIGVYQSDQGLVLQVAQVKDSNTQTKITLLADLVTSTVEAITAVIPSCQNAARGFKALPPYSLSTFTAHYNSILIAKTGNKAVDASTQQLQLHRHSKIARTASFGWLN